MLARSRTRSRRSRRFRHFGWLLIPAAVVAFVGLAPQLILQSPLLNKAIITASGIPSLQLSVGSVSGGWFSPIRLRDFRATNEAGQELVGIDRVSVGSLLSLVSSGFSHVDITLDQPHLTLSFAEGASNWEPVLKAWEPGESTGEGRYLVRVQNGSIEVNDSLSGEVWMLERLQGQLSSAPAGSLELVLSAELQADQRGTLQVEFTSQDGSHRLVSEVAGLELAASNLLMRRFVSDQWDIAGQTSGRVTVGWGADHARLDIEDLVVQRLELRTAAWLPEERIFLPRLAANGSLETDAEGWRAHELAFHSQVASLRLSGAGRDAGAEVLANTRELLRTLTSGQLECSGEVDFAHLAAVLPRTLHLREGTRITSGKASFEAASSAAGEATQWDGRLTTSGLTATTAERPLVWDDPLHLEVAATHLPSSWRMDRLACRGSFLLAEAQGSLESGTLSFNGDLSQFVEDAGQFFEIEANELSGQVAGSATWQHAADGRLHLTAETQTNDFRWVLAKRQPWYEPNLRLLVRCDARVDGQRLSEIVAGNLQLRSGDDVCVANLAGPVRLSESSSWPLHLHLVGDLASWLSRVQLAAGASDYRLDGDVELDADVEVGDSRASVKAGRATLRGLRGELAGLTLDESLTELELAGMWDFRQQRGSASHVSCANTTVAFRAEDLDLALQPQLDLHGKIGYRVDLERLSRLLGATSHRLQGQLVGNADFSDDGSQTIVQGSAEASAFAYSIAGGGDRRLVRPVGTSETWSELWSEERLTLAVHAAYDRSAATAQLERIELASQAVSVGAAGVVRDLDGLCELELDGQVAYDLHQLSSRLGPRAGIPVKFSGVSTQPFRFRGPLRATTRESSPLATASGADGGGWARFSGRTKFAWDTAAIYGFAIGEGVVDAELAAGRLTLQPLDLRVSDGRVRMAPTFDLRQQPIVLELPGGTAIERVAISQQMCHGWLKYLAPFVAESTAVEGQLSLAVGETRLPLSSSLDANVTGTLDIHSARIGPGPLANQLLAITEQLRVLLRQKQPRAVSQVWIDMPAQKIDFHVQDRRVYHRGLEFLVDGDVRVVTTGSVGFDQSMSLVATVPIPDRWVASDRWLSALRGQSLQIPVAGTLSSPRLDTRALDQIAKGLVGGAAGRLLEQEAGRFLEQELGRGLERLLGPRE